MSVAVVRIRRARTDEVARIVELNRALFRDDAGRRDPFVNLGWPDEEGQRHFADLVSRERSLCLLAESDGEVVGYLAGYVVEGTSLRPVVVAELESMYVREGHRGRGLGARLVEEFLKWARVEGAERASVTAYAANGRAIDFYERHGFRPKNLALERDVR